MALNVWFSFCSSTRVRACREAGRGSGSRTATRGPAVSRGARPDRSSIRGTESSAEVPVQGDLGVQDLRHGAVLLRGARQLLELAAVDARHLPLEDQRRLADLE